MATCIPIPEQVSSGSEAEIKLLKALCEQLSPEYVVMHSVAWISKPKGLGARDGETDLLIVHPQEGVLAIEVKGGRVSLDYVNRRWTSIDRYGVEHPIKNPFEQAKQGKFGVLEKLKEHPDWGKAQIRRFNLGHAVFFPDIRDGARLRGPDAPEEIIGDESDLSQLSQWIMRAFRYWEGTAVGSFDEIGNRGIRIITSVFARVSTTRSLLSARIGVDEEYRIRLTRMQASVLDILRRQRRVMIAGGAGTGKTLIAREKAVRLANEGMKTLLVCFNRGLADHLREQCADIPNLDVATFHQVCHKWIGRAKRELGRDLLGDARSNHPQADEFGQLMPLALANAVDALGPAYDAIVVDEGQDFGDEYWLPIEMLLTSLDQGILYVFLDENQDIYRRSARIPISSEPFVLDRNCRNTEVIHRIAYRHYRGAPVLASDIKGLSTQAIHAAGLERQARSIVSLLIKLIAEEKIAPHDIAVLMCDAKERDTLERLLFSAAFPKPANIGRIETYGKNTITVESVARFKGLERDVIILCAFDGCNPERDREILYVGMSRAKSMLFLCGSPEAIERVSG